MTPIETAVALKFTDAHYIALGKMVVQFQELEQAITIGLLRLMQPTDLGLAFGFTHTVINELSFANRLKLLSNFVETHPVTHFVPIGSQYEKGKTEDYHEELGQLREGLRMAAMSEQKRNGLIHSSWLTDPVGGPPGTVLRVKKRTNGKRIHGTMEFVTANDILAIVEEMKLATDVICKAASHLHIFLFAQNLTLHSTGPAQKGAQAG